MFLVFVNYKAPIETVDNFLSAHSEYLKQHYKTGEFILSGRRVPRTGGVIMSVIEDKENLKNVLAQDPFNLNNVADYEIIEINPTMACEQLDFLMGKQ